MPAGHQQQQIRECYIVTDAGSESMPFQMINGDKRLIQRDRQGFGRHNADNHAADEPRPWRRSNSVYIFQRQPGFGKALFQNTVNMIQMRTGGYFGNNTAKRLMFFLRQQRFAKNFLFIVYQRRRRFITTAFYP